MRLTDRGYRVLAVASIIFFLAIMSISGAIETQDIKTCEDYQAEQDWQSAWDNGCPFQNEEGQYLYIWTP